MLKVIQINSVSGYGSTGRICTDLAETITKQGHFCYIAYGQLNSDYQNSYKIGSAIENHLHNAGSRLFGKQGYFSKNGTKKLIQYINEINPDVIHLHNLHGNYLNLEMLFDFLANTDIPVVWTLHDCWAFTGKCAHYTNIGCYKWQIQCHHCPQIETYPPSLFFDRSELMFKDKKKWFTSVENMTIITVSNWLAKEVNQSFLAKYPIIPIHNWIDHTKFKPTESNFKSKVGIENKFMILVVSAGWDKSSTRFKDLIKLSELFSDDTQFIMVGNFNEKHLLTDNIIHVAYVNGINEMAEIYSAADVYVHLSVEDTFGKVIAEAMSCGTPVIVYDSTACPEIVGEGCGIVVNKRDVLAVAKAIKQIKSEGKQKYAARCRSYVQENFDLKENTEKTIQIYQSIISK